MSTTPRWTTELAIVGVWMALLAFALPDLVAWAHTWRPAKAAPVQTSARIQCPRPSELETLLVFVNVSAEGQVRLECAPTGPRGAYVKPTRRTTP